MDIHAILVEAQSLFDDAALRDESNLEARAEALDFVDFAEEVVASDAHVHGPSREHAQLRRTLRALAQELNAVDRELFRRTREAIQEGALRGPALRRMLDRFATSRHDAGDGRHLGFGTLDRLVNGFLFAAPPPEPAQELAPEMIGFQATPVSVTLDLVDHVAFDAGDVFYDIGSGLGQVVMLTHLLTGVPTVGIEIEPAFCAYAQSQAATLGLTGVDFVNVDAQDAAYSRGTHFYLFTPFTGALLASVLHRLAQHAAALHARDKALWICTYGPCTAMVAAAPWLRSVNTHHNDPFRLAIFRSIPSRVTL